MKYKVSIQLDELLKEKKISQYSLIKKTNLSHNFINKLVKHKEVANLDKLATIINALNDEGADIRPSDLIKFVPVDETTVDIFSSQQFDDSFYFFSCSSINGGHTLTLLSLQSRKATTTPF
jgi:hypothetical protein